MKVERVSYDVMTPSAARGIFEAILWKPAIRWNVTRIEVLNPIQWISVRRNEVGKVMSRPSNAQLDGRDRLPPGFFIEDERQQRAGLFLRDVRYRIHGYFDFIPIEKRLLGEGKFSGVFADSDEENVNREDETPAKYAAMFERRAKRGQCFHRPYLGCREFACDFVLVDPGLINKEAPPIDETRDLGFMLYDMDFTSDKSNPRPTFFRARLNQGIIDTDYRRVEVRR